VRDNLIPSKDTAIDQSARSSLSRGDSGWPVPSVNTKDNEHDRSAGQAHRNRGDMPAE